VNHLANLFVGLGSGAVYAIIGLGLVLTFRGSGVINVAHGAVAMYAAYTYAFLRGEGAYMVPIPGLPPKIHLIPGYDEVSGLRNGMAFVPSLIIALLTAGLLGAMQYYLVYRPLRRAPALARVVASVGVMLLLQTIVQVRFEYDPANVPVVSAILPEDPITIFGTRVPARSLWLGLVAVVVAGLLSYLYARTRFGLATRAAAENEKGATLLGFSPDTSSLANWVLAAVVAGLAGILIAPSLSLNTVIYTFFVIQALAAALVGRFTSFWATLLGGFALGIVEAEINTLRTDWSFLRAEGIDKLLPFVVIVAVLFFTGSALPTRATLSEGRLPFAPAPKFSQRNVIISALLIVFVVGCGFSGNIELRGSMLNTLTGAMLTLSVVVLTGFVGQISLAQLTFAGVAGYSLYQLGTQAGIPFPFAPILAIAIATILGVIVAIPALRVRGVTLAVVTLSAAYAAENFLFKNPKIVGGFEGSAVPRPQIFGLDLGVSSEGQNYRPAFTLFCLVVLVLLCFLVVNLRRSGTGQRMLAVRANERAAAAAGIDVPRTKLLAFAISSFIAGVAGVMKAYQQVQISPASYATLLSIVIFAFAYLGGITTVSGALLGGLLFPGGVSTYFWSWLGTRVGWLSWVSKYELLIGGAGLIISAILNPEGIAGRTIEKRAEREARRATKRAATTTAVAA
jgi:ABC-type branched-subunit amino acid transport system permease subunit